MDPRDKPELIVMLATSWGAQDGGITTFNRDFTHAMARLLSPSFTVVCVTLEASANDIADASNCGVTLLPIGKSDKHNYFEASRAQDVINTVTNRFGALAAWWIGHDFITGPIAIRIRHYTGIGHTAVIMHMDSFSYVDLKSDGVSSAIEKNRNQREVIEKADIAFAVGPKLYAVAKSFRKASGKSDPIELIPGLASIQGVDLPPHFSAITFGRFDGDNDRIKLARLAVASFGHVVKKYYSQMDGDPTISVLGVNSPLVATELKQLAELNAGRTINVIADKYTTDREWLFSFLRVQSVCLMLSIHEGFGLSGWEAISAEVPLILTTNSGLYQFIENTLAGAGTGCVYGVDIRGSTKANGYSNEDIKTVSSALQQVLHKPEFSKRNARQLKNMLQSTYTWDNTAAQAADALQIEYPRKQAIADLAQHRLRHIKEVCLEISSSVLAHQNLVLFGGIASGLRDESAIRAYTTWLLSSSNTHLYICYECGPAARARANLLNSTDLPDNTDLPTEPPARMAEKTKRVLDMRSKLLSVLSSHGLNIDNRIHFIPLTQQITAYIMMLDSVVYFTPLFQERSSMSISMKLDSNAEYLREQVLDYIEYNVFKLIKSSDLEESLNLGKLRQHIIDIRQVCAMEYNRARNNH